ncbi:MAG: Nif3-like dinuclear metal center hexameric protein [Candidatus Kapaibacterium sp.]
MLLTDFVRAFHTHCPPATAMEGDRLGLLVQSGRLTVERMMVCLDVTMAIIDEARSKNVDTILTFHPLIFRPLTSIRSDDRVGACVESAIRHGIAIVSAHTNVDAHPRGTNAVFAQRMGWSVESVLVPDPVHHGHGMGTVCAIEPTSMTAVIDKVVRTCGSPVRWNEGSKDMVTKVAIVCGSGSSFLADARRCGAEVFITADVRYHTFLEAQGDIAIIDPGHFEMEQFVPHAIRDIVVSDVLGGRDDVDVLVTEVSTNPVRYR